MPSRRSKGLVAITGLKRRIRAPSQKVNILEDFKCGLSNEVGCPSSRKKASWEIISASILFCEENWWTRHRHNVGDVACGVRIYCGNKYLLKKIGESQEHVQALIWSNRWKYIRRFPNCMSWRYRISEPRGLYRLWGHICYEHCTYTPQKMRKSMQQGRYL